MEKIKIYLDTNIIYGFFKSITELAFRGRPYKENRKLKFIQENLEKIEPYTSFFTLVEVVEELKKYRKITAEQLRSLLKFFTESFNITVLQDISLTNNVLEYVLGGLSHKDSIHLEIAKNKDLMLITDDKDLQRIGKHFYEKIMSYTEMMVFILSSHL